MCWQLLDSSEFESSCVSGWHGEWIRLCVCTLTEYIHEVHCRAGTFWEFNSLGLKLADPLHGGSGGMAFNLPPPQPLEIHDANAFEKWNRFSRAWHNYSLATGVSTKTEEVQVATLLTVVGEEAREVYTTFSWEIAGDEVKRKKVLDQFKAYCQPSKNIPFERYMFNRREQEAGESYDQYRTGLRKLADNCSFGTITPDEVLRDRLVFGIRDSKVRERLLREPNLTLARTDEVCRAAESMLLQIKAIGGGDSGHISAVSTTQANKLKKLPECWNCGRRHDITKKELCSAFGKACSNCGKLNHFAAKCRSSISKNAQHKVQAVDHEQEEVFHVSADAVLDDSQFITVALDSGNFIRFQVDTGVQCNVIPVHIYQRATGDVKMAQVVPANSSISVYGGAHIPVVGTVTIKVWRMAIQYKLSCKLIENTHVRPLLGRRACLGMKVVQYTDNDLLYAPAISSGEVYAVHDGKTPIVVNDLMQCFSKAFADGPGTLEGYHHIKLDPRVEPVQHAPRCVPVPIRDKLRRLLDDMVQQEIITPMVEPTKWVSSKKNGDLRICLDPKDLN